jgi:hypothetical protein
MSQLKIKQIDGLQTVLDAINLRLESGSLKSEYTQVSHGFSPGTAVCILDGSWVLADSSTADKLGRLIIESVDTDTFIAVQLGNIYVADWGLTPGKYYVVDDSGNGTLAEYVSPFVPNLLYSNPIIQAITSQLAQVLPWRPSLGSTPMAQGQEYTQSSVSLLTDGNYASTGISLNYTPFIDSTLQVYINGIAVTEGYGNRVDDCYFSNDGGITSRQVQDIVAGDILYWNTSITGFAIGAGDNVDIVYQKNSLD